MRSVQTLIFDKKEYSRNEALLWARLHGFKHYTSRETADTFRIRQFEPKRMKVLGTFSLTKGIKALYVVKR
jgi:hypothetical protein